MRKLLVMTAIALVAIFVVAPRFVRWTSDHAKTSVGTAALRLGVLQRTAIDSNTVADSADVVAVVMDWNMGGNTTATLVAYTGGRTSLFVSPGKVFTSNSDRVREAADRFREAVANHSDHFSTTADFDPPTNAHVRFYIITRTGTFATSRFDQIAVLQNETQPLHSLLEAGTAAASELQRPN